jgi:DNA replication protein DnaC
MLNNIPPAAAGGQMMDASYLMNMMMSGYMMNMMTQLKESSFSVQTVLMFLLMVSIGEIKKIVLELIEEGKKSVPIWWSQGKEWVMETLSCRFRKPPAYVEEFTNYVPTVQGHCLTVSLTPNISALNALYKYISKEQIGTIDNQIGLTVQSLQTSNTKITYRDCMFPLDDNIHVSLRDSITFIVDNQTNAVVGTEKTVEPDVDITKSVFYTFLKVNPDVQKKIVEEAKKHTFKEWEDYCRNTLKINVNSGLGYDNTSVDEIILYLSSKEQIVWQLLQDIIRLYCKDNSIPMPYNMCVLEMICIITFCNLCMKNMCSINYSKSTYSYYINSVYQNQSFNVCITLKKDYKINCPRYASYSTVNDTVNGVSRNLTCDIPNFHASKDSTETTSSGKQLEFYVSTQGELISTKITDPGFKDSSMGNFGKISDPNKYLYDRFYEFYTKTIVKNVADNTKKEITVYSICYISKETKEEKENPEYNEWHDMVSMVEGEKLGTALLEYMKIKPPKTLHVTTTTMEIQCQKVNTFYKDLNTLYLREEDKCRLLNIVDKFKHKKHLYDQLGIPHKLGMMFYGAPGTGKTTSIKAIASYLGKDLYFVNLKNVKKNAHLKEIFDHIHNNCNGGVIIFEDIDAMTDVVHKRTASTEKPMTNVLEEANDELTLSYLLNMLDGSLCKDGTIFALTTNHIEKIDPALYRKGRVDITIDFKLCDHYQFNMIYQSIMGRNVPEELLACIPENKYAPCDVIFHIYQYMLDDVKDADVLEEFMEKE